MRFKKYLFALLFASAAVTVALVSCNVPVSSMYGAAGLAITVKDNTNARTLAPTIDMNAANYTITGTGPYGATFAASTTGAAVTQTSLALGTWTIVVNAINADSDLIGTVTGTALVSYQVTTPVSISVIPVAGTGVLTLGVSWPSPQVQAPAINASLTPALGVAQSLTFTVVGATATYTNSLVGNGYYTLAFALLDGTIAVAGAVDVVRIVQGQTTTGTYALSNINTATGLIQVGINANLQNPLLVAITGATATMTQGSVQALTASVSNYAGGVVYVWYANGVSVSTGATYNFGASQPLGYYRLDVVAFSADGTQAGSATTNVQILTASPPLVALATSGNYTVLATSGITIGAGVSVAGNVGLNMVSGGLSGFAEVMDASNTYATSSLVSGRVYASDYAAPTPAALTTAHSDMTAAYNDAAGRLTPNGTNLGSGELGGMTFTPGLYKWTTAALITNDITLNGGPDDVWIFQVNGALSMAASTTIHLTGGANPKNIFWQSVGAFSMGATSTFKGIVLSNGVISLGANDTIDGRFFGQSTVTIGDGTTVTQP